MTQLLTHLPFSDESERAVLAGVLLQPDLLSRTIGVLEKEDFYREAHQAIYGAMQGVDADGTGVDMRTVQAALEHRGELERVGGLAYLAGLDVDLPDLDGFDAYVQIVVERSLRRRLIQLASTMTASCLDGAGKTGTDVLTSAEVQLRKLADRAVPDRSATLGEAVYQVLEAAEQRDGRGPLGLSTGFADIDRKLHGLRPGNLVCIAGRPGSGKTSLAMQFAAEQAIRRGAPVGVFSVEMSSDELATRMLCTEADISHDRLMEGFLSQRQWQHLIATARRIADVPLLIDDDGGLDLVRLVSRARRWRAESGVQLILVDHLNLLTAGDRRYESRVLEVGTITRGLKKLAKELGIPIVVLSQLNRQGARRGDHRPVLEDLRESGATEQDCDAVLFVFREELVNPGDTSLRGLAEVIVAKNRHGATGTVELTWAGEVFRFRQPAKNWQTEAAAAAAPAAVAAAGGDASYPDPWSAGELSAPDSEEDQP